MVSDPLRKRLRTLAFTGVLTALAACGGGPGSINPQPPSVPGRCVENTAEDYAASASVPLDVRVYDENADALGGCFTNYERSWIDELGEARRLTFDDGSRVVSDEQLQAFVDYYPTVGPMIVGAFPRWLAEYRTDVTFEPDVISADPDKLGWVDLQTILPDHELPASNAASGGIDHWNIGEPRTNYPELAQNRNTVMWGFLDWDDAVGSSTPFLEEFGHEPRCNTAQDVANKGSLDMNMHFPFDGETFERREYGVFNGTFGPATVVTLAVFDETFPGYGSLNDAVVKVRYDVHPDDRTLFDADVVYYSYAHVNPTNTRYFSKEDFPFAEGDTIPRGARIGVVNSYLPAQELDLSLTVPPSFGFGPTDLAGDVILDPPAARWYPERKAPWTVQPRVSQDLRVFAPCYDEERNEFPNLPDEP